MNDSALSLVPALARVEERVHNGGMDEPVRPIAIPTPTPKELLDNAGFLRIGEMRVRLNEHDAAMIMWGMRIAYARLVGKVGKVAEK